MKSSVIAAIAVVVIVVAAAGGYYAYASTRGGEVYVYVEDPGHSNSSVLGIYLTVSSIMVHSSTTGKWITISNRSETVALSSVPQLLASSSIPQGNYTEVRLYITSVTVQVGSINVSARVPSSVLKIPIVNGGLSVRPGRKAYLVISMGPHVTQTGSGAWLVSPVAVAYAYYNQSFTSTNTTSA